MRSMPAMRLVALLMGAFLLLGGCSGDDSDDDAATAGDDDSGSEDAGEVEEDSGSDDAGSDDAPDGDAAEDGEGESPADLAAACEALLASPQAGDYAAVADVTMTGDVEGTLVWVAPLIWGTLVEGQWSGILVDEDRSEASLDFTDGSMTLAGEAVDPDFEGKTFEGDVATLEPSSDPDYPDGVFITIDGEVTDSSSGEAITLAGGIEVGRCNE